MNILLINHYAGSPEMGMEFRPYYLAKKWNEKGHNTIILAADKSHIRRKNPDISKDFEEQIIDGVKYVWIKTPEYLGNGVRRFLNMLVFVKKLFFNAKNIAKKYKPDVVIASSTYPLDNYVARRIAKIAPAKYIYEVHDLWPLSPMELGGMSKWHPFIIIMQIAENFAYKHCDAVVSILPKTKEHCIKHGLKPEKWFHVPNGICLDDFKQQEDPPEQHLKIIENLRAAGKNIVGYTGGHAISNALEPLILAAKTQKNENTSFVLVGDGVEKPKLIKLADNSKNITFLPLVKKTQLPALLKKFDILYLGFRKQNLYNYGVSPNKIFDYMLAAKPVIFSFQDEENIVSQANCGITIEPENPQAINIAVEKILSLPQEERQKMGENGRNYVLKNHTYEVLSEKFLKIFEQIG